MWMQLGQRRDAVIVCIQLDNKRFRAITTSTINIKSVFTMFNANDYGFMHVDSTDFKEIASHDLLYLSITRAT